MPLLGLIPDPNPEDVGTEVKSNRAVAVLHGDLAVHGTVWFYQESEESPVQIKGEIHGLTPGLHGFHIHQYGDSTDGCESAGPHFNPYDQTHGGPQSVNRHVGDLGNIEAGNDGIAKFDLQDSIISLHGERCIIGRSLVCHSDPDDLGTGGDNESLKTGNSGARVCCGVVARAAPK